MQPTGDKTDARLRESGWRHDVKGGVIGEGVTRNF